MTESPTAQDIYCREHSFATYSVEQIREMMLSASAADAPTVSLKSAAPALRKEYRKTQKLTIAPPLPDALTAEIAAVISDITAFYKMSKHGIQEFQWLLYRPGDYFTRHKDGSNDPAAPPHVRARRVSVVMYFGNAGDEGDFTGGELVLFFKPPADSKDAQQTAVKITPKRGLVAAFPSNIAHEVLPIKSGVRLSLVTWLTE